MPREIETAVRPGCIVRDEWLSFTCECLNIGGLYPGSDCYRTAKYVVTTMSGNAVLCCGTHLRTIRNGRTAVRVRRGPDYLGIKGIDDRTSDS